MYLRLPDEVLVVTGQHDIRDAILALGLAVKEDDVAEMDWVFHTLSYSISHLNLLKYGPFFALGYAA